MPRRLAVACGIVFFALLGFFEFPGHTYLQSDTQIYVPMMERIVDPSALTNDLVAAKPHLSFTIYDEVAIGARRLFGAPFQATLVTEQVLFRILQIGGIYLLATALPLSAAMSLAAAGVAGLGAFISGPAVVLMEYEPVPRGFATALLFLAMGLAARGWLVWASAAASLAFLYHAPTTLPFWICFFPLLIWKRNWRALLPFAAAIVVIAGAAHFQPGAAEPQRFFIRIDPAWEQLQRMRASYNWVSLWARQLMGQYVFFWIASLAAVWRVRPQAGRVFLIGLPAIAMLSVPVSYLLLEGLKWELVPQVQPARALLFVTGLCMILSAAAGLRARSKLESAAWFALAFAIPMQGALANLTWRQIALAAGLGAATALLGRYRLVTVAAAYFLIPILGRVQNYPRIETPELDQVAAFAKDHTSKESVFLFPAAGRGLQPGIFRARAVRAVYVDWKAGGQANYYRSLANEWWSKWLQADQLNYRPQDVPRLAALGIHYLVLPPDAPASGSEVFRNRAWTVYRISP